MDIQTLRKNNFVLWRPGKTNPVPEVLITQVKFDYQQNKLEFNIVKSFPLTQLTKFPDVWLIDAKICELEDNQVYHYWFKVANNNAYEANNNLLYCTDPFATVVDERIQAYNLPINKVQQTHYSPAAVLKYKADGTLVPADPDGTEPDWGQLYTSDVMDKLKPNNQLVIYELPPRWSKTDTNNNICMADGNFRQVEKMIDYDGNDTYLNQILKDLIPQGRKYIEYIGVNALELTPPANSSQEYDWGYGTADYSAPDFNLCVRVGDGTPNPATDFINLVKACHKKGIRFFYDAVMAFASNNSYRNINYLDFFIQWNANDPEQRNRDGFGGDLIKYKYMINTYNPNTGQIGTISPSREYMIAHLNEWIKNKGVSGLRLDSVVNIDCFDFLSEIKEQTRNYYKQTTSGTNDKYLVVAEELSVPSSLLNQQVVDGQWNEVFKQILRQVILGKNWWGEPNFEWCVRKMIDCRLLGRGFTDGAQAINYVTSHDVGGDENIRLFSYLNNNGVSDTQPRIKLAFSCMMTAIGIPMILAGEEFGDAQDLLDNSGKQRDPISYQRLANDEWRQNIFTHVRRLIHLRTTSKALWYNDIDFIHSDFNDGKRVVAWKRGQGTDIVVTVANFSDWSSPQNYGYIVNNMPTIPNGFQWIEITQSRFVQNINNEKIMPWEAKVYSLQSLEYKLCNESN
jgi:1,4-alpha-glucan branching enzyme